MNPKEVFLKLSENLNSLYDKRRKMNLWRKFIWIFTGFYIIILIGIIISNLYSKQNVFTHLQKALESLIPNYSLIVLFGILMLLISFSSYVFSYFNKKYYQQEDDIITRSINTLFPNDSFTMWPENHKLLFRKSKLFSWLRIGTPVHEYGELEIRQGNGESIIILDIGVIEGNFKNKFLNFISQIPGVNLLYIAYLYIYNAVKSEADYTFRGLFCSIPFQKNLKGYTVILSNKFQNKIDRAVSKRFKKEQQIVLEDMAFGDNFLVYSTDAVEAHYILSTKIMERINDLQTKFNRPIQLSFFKDKIYMTISNPNGFFSLEKKALDNSDLFEELVSDVILIKEINQQLSKKQY